ncbi:MAG: response regulator [Patescibacteria group bacterium]
MPDSQVRKIIIIENDEFLSAIYKTKFESEGFKVTAINDGAKGLKAVQTKKPDIVLLDVLLPKLDGFTILQALKKDEATKDIPVVLLTNLGQKEDVKKGLEMGAADYLIKTHFKPSETVDKVKKILNTMKGGERHDK